MRSITIHWFNYSFITNWSLSSLVFYWFANWWTSPHSFKLMRIRDVNFSWLETISFVWTKFAIKTKRSKSKAKKTSVSSNSRWRAAMRSVKQVKRAHRIRSLKNAAACKRNAYRRKMQAKHNWWVEITATASGSHAIKCEDRNVWKLLHFDDTKLNAPTAGWM